MALLTPTQKIELTELPFLNGGNSIIFSQVITI